MRYSKEDIQRARDTLAYLKPGDTIYTILRHVSRSGMSRSIGLVSFRDRKFPMHPNWAAACLLGWSVDRNGRDGVRVDGCGMDMGFHLVYELSGALFGDGYALKQEWL